MDDEALERFMKFVDVSGECWLWTANKNKDGYGQFNFDGKQWLAHRLMYQHCYGFLTPGLVICHTCRNKCVNPDHLEEKTVKENCFDRLRDGTNCCGENHNKAKLTEEQVLEIRSRSTESKICLAKEFRVSRPEISHIIYRKTWKHI